VADARPGRAEVEERVLGYLRRELVDPDVTVARDTDLLAGGVLDSIAVLRLATFVGEEFGIEIRPADFVIENFRSVEAVAAFVESARAGDGDGGRP
jgi:acyl carrier protein